MSKRYINYNPIARINSVPYFKEKDMLKWSKRFIAPGVIGPHLIMEGYQINNSFDTHVLGGCYNSIPYFLRMQERQEGHESWFEGSLNKHASVLVEGNYEKLCPKVAWGFTAYLACHTKIDEEFGLCFYLKGSEVAKERLFLEYHYLCRKAYISTNYENYSFYEENKDYEGIASVYYFFYKDHIRQERRYIRQCIIDDLLFEGQLKKIAGEYLEYLKQVYFFFK